MSSGAQWGKNGRAVVERWTGRHTNLGRCQKSIHITSGVLDCVLSMNSPSKPSKPSRAYLKVKEPALLDELAAIVKQASFQDAKNTAKDPCLLGPPSLEFALYTRVPGSRIRHDGRQGTIDQDQEFIEFLQSLTEPVGKPANDAAAADGKLEKAITTPLVQYLKEKKAAKAKEAAAAKTAKAKEAKEAKESKAEKTGKTTVVVKNAPTSAEKARVAKATQDAVKAINKSVASMQSKTSPQKADAKARPTAPTEKDATVPTVKPPRERGSAAVANRILQRDLGLAPKESKTRAAKASAAAKVVDTTPKGAVSGPTQSPVTAKPLSEIPGTATPAPPTGPRNSRPSSAAAVKPNIVPVARPAKPLPQPTPGAKSAFLKHANASQGVTEDLLRAAFETFGTLAKCEIDKKKGFGYVDFTETEGLKNAMQASPVKVGNGQVVVLENKTRKPVPPPAASPASVASTPNDSVAETTNSAMAGGAASVDAKAASTGTDPTVQPIISQPMPPRAPRAPLRGAGPVFNRGRSGFPSGRGNLPIPRGAPRGNFRGGRGGMRGGPIATAAGSPGPNATPGAPATNTTGGGDQST
jgi:regulator of nonsense transcripts 3